MRVMKYGLRFLSGGVVSFLGDYHAARWSTLDPSAAEQYDHHIRSLTNLSFKEATSDILHVKGTKAVLPWY
jgi:hypothetical protein